MFKYELQMMRKRIRDREKQIRELKKEGATDQQLKWMKKPGQKIEAGG